MNKRFQGPGIILLASIVTFLFVSFKLSFLTYQELIAVLIGFIVLLYGRSFKAGQNEVSKAILLFASTLSVQLLIISSGGFLSPFFILFHIFTLALAFYNLQTSLTFLIFTLADLSFFILITPELLQMVRGDPGTTLLYFASLMAIIPFSRLLASSYHLKVELANVLSNKVKLGETILENLDELIFITDKDLNIISINSAVERALSVSRSVIIGKPLFDYLFLKDPSSQLVNEKSISNHQLNHLQLLTKNNFKPKEVNLRIRPTVSPDGLIEELTFIISNASEPQALGSLNNLDKAWIGQMALIEDLRNRLFTEKEKDLRLLTELISRSSRDLNTAFELEEGRILIDPTLVDVAQISEKTVASSTNFAEALKVKLAFNLANFSTEYVKSMVPEGVQAKPAELTSAYFTALVDIGWFGFCLQKLIDIALLLSSTNPNSNVALTIEREANNISLIKIDCSDTVLSDSEVKEIFMPYYGSLATNTNLKLGSGLEGSLAKSLLDLMNIKLETQSKENSLEFIIRVSKQPPAPTGQ